MTVAKKKVDELHEFVKGKNNVHHQIRHLLVEIRLALHSADRKRMARKKKTEDSEIAWRRRADDAEKALLKAAKTPEVSETPKSFSDPREQKRPRNAARGRILEKTERGQGRHGGRRS